MIVRKILEPSREDAVRLTRNEKLGMLWFYHSSSTLDDLEVDMADRIRMIENGPERMRKITEELDKIVNELRMTIPMNQRMNLQNTVDEYEVRIAPKATPSKTSVVMQKEEFRDLVDFARIQCRECVEDDKSCKNCKLYQLMTVINPVDDYHGLSLCPYALGVWKN